MFSFLQQQVRDLWAGPRLRNGEGAITVDAFDVDGNAVEPEQAHSFYLSLATHAGSIYFCEEGATLEAAVEHCYQQALEAHDVELEQVSAFSARLIRQGQGPAYAF